MQWYYAINSQRQGPLAQAEFEQFVAQGTIRPDTLVWHEGMAQWQPYSEVAPAAGTPTASPDDTEVCALSGKRYPKREMIQYEGKWISAEHRDEYFQRLREGVAQPNVSVVPGPYGYGGFWRRFLAVFVDGIALWAINTVLNLIIGAVIGLRMAITPGHFAEQIGLFVVLQSLSIVIGVAYQIFFIRKFDATPGKLALGIKILRADGSKLSVGRIVGRYFAYMLSGFTLCIGYIMAGVDDEKRALHDRICDTRVIKTRA